MKKFIFCLIAIVAAGIGVAFAFANVNDAIGASLALTPLLGQLSRQELEDIAEEALSDSFGGYEEYEGMELDEEDMYDGFDDPAVTFIGNAKSFLDEKKAGIYLTFRIVNNSGYSKVICLNPAYFDTRGVTVTKEGANVTEVVINNTSIAEMTASNHPEIHAVISDGLIFGTAEKGITCTATNGRILDHLRFVKKNPTRIPEITISSTVASTGAIDTTTYTKIMTIRRVSPYRRFTDSLIDLNDSFKVSQYQAAKIVVDTNEHKLQADDQTLIFVEIDNDRSVTFKMCIGGSGNAAAVIYKKAEQANNNIMRGTAGKVPAPVRTQMKKVANKQMSILRKMAFKRGKK